MAQLAQKRFYEYVILEDICLDDMYTNVNLILYSYLENKLNGSLNLLQNVLLVYKQRRVHIRMPLFYEEWVEKYLDSDFFMHFRLIKSTYRELCTVIGKQLAVRKYRGGYAIVPLEKEVLMTLWYLAKGDTLVSISDRFDVSVSKVYYITTKIIYTISCLMPMFIKWPTKGDCLNIAKDFKQRGNYPDVIGAIDGCHVVCKIPSKQHDSYQDRKFTHSITLQGVCISSRLLTNVSIGYPGSVHDARILRESELGKAVERNPDLLFYGKYHLLGDSAYPLRKWLITPFKNTGNLSPLMHKHNYVHSVTRVIIENTFGMIKGRWRILNFVNVYTVKKTINIIAACCVLHNFCLLNCDDYEFDALPIEQDDNQVYIGHSDAAAQEKRNTLAKLL